MMNTERRPAPGQIAKIRREVELHATPSPSGGGWTVQATVASTGSDSWHRISDMYSREYERQLREFAARQ
jgi:hypothetical protein